MGLDYNTTKFILYSKMRGVDFSDTLMLGRQCLYLHPKELDFLLRSFRMPAGEAALSRFYGAGDLAKGKFPYAEDVLRHIGAGRIMSLDASNYEGASVIHDMNTPVGESLHGAFSVVIDGGTLEHIYNLPVAIQNCMTMLRVGGHFISVAPANNFVGHGFYQFSPELFFRTFSQHNGFDVKDMFLCEVKARKLWYKHPDPAAVGGRLEFTNRGRLYILLLAEKISAEVPENILPAQSDYEHQLWTDKDETGLSRRLHTLGRVKSLLPLSVINRIVPLWSELKSVLRRPFSSLVPFDPLAANNPPTRA